MKRGFASRVYSWGLNYNNLGYSAEVPMPITVPAPVALESPVDIKKIICGYSESVFLTNEGKIHCWGHFEMFDKFITTPTLLNSTQNLNFTDIDISKTHFLGLTTEGEIYQITGKQSEKIELPGKARLLAAGNQASFAVVTGENGSDRIYAWSSQGPENGAIFCAQHDLPRPVSELIQANYWLDQLQTNVKKIKVVESAVVVLLENGELLTWGDNASGNLGVYRSELALLENEVFQPTRINLANGIKEKVVDFDLSDNILIALTESNQAYFCGLENIFTIRSIPFFPDQKIVKVGAEHNKYYLFSSNGKVFSNRSFDNEEFIKYYGEFDLYEVDRKYFGGAEVEFISGKYDNAVAVCK